MLYASIIYFVLLHAPGGDEIEVNVGEITSLRKPRESGGLVTSEAGCVLHMTSGGFITVSETCLDVIQKIADLSRKEPH